MHYLKKYLQKREDDNNDDKIPHGHITSLVISLIINHQNFVLALNKNIWKTGS